MVAINLFFTAILLEIKMPPDNFVNIESTTTDCLIAVTLK